MCGITGFYNNGEKSRTELQVIGKAMTESISHRGPDGHGLWQDPDLPLLLGHRRLSIIDLSEAGAQPMCSHTDRYVMTYNGEIYNYLELQKTLEGHGVKFKGRSDTEVILAAIEHWGINQTLQKLNGMFALALWDRKERTLHFARDRLGKKPLYIGWAGKSLIFGSELKALRAHPSFQAELNKEAAALYMRYSYVPAPHSIYKNIWSLPAGFRLTLNLEKLKPKTELQEMMEPYWHHARAIEEAKNRTNVASEDTILGEFEALLTTCVSDRLVSDVPLGAFLSGGIDSSTVVALMQKISTQPVKTYSIGFEEAGFDEAAYAKKIAAHLGTDHHELYVSGQDALEVIPNLSQIYDEPFGDISSIPTHLVSKFARKSVTVALSGDGGDEMLGGYNRHVAGPKIWNRVRTMPGPLRALVSNTVQKVPVRSWDALARSQPQFGTRIHKAASVLSLNTQEEIYQRLTSQWEGTPVLDTPLPETLTDDPRWQIQGLSFAEMMMYRDALSYLSNDILTKVDRASMAAGLEARAPLLDKRIYDYVWALPEKLKIRNGRGKYLLRQVLGRHVPSEMFERPKQGFAIPAGEWLSGPLKDWAEVLLNESMLQQQGIFDTELIRNTWNEHLNGQGNHASKLWSVLMFQSWHDKWMKT